MNRTANVTSIDALDRARAALCMFGEEAGQALAELRSEVDRFVEWLEHEQLQYWQREIRTREERLNEAKIDLHRCLSATIDPQHTPSCIQEKKVVEAAKRRLEEAEQKVAAVRRWIPVIRQSVFEYRTRIEPLSGALAADLPRAVAHLQTLTSQLLAYLELPPTSTTAEPSRADEPASASMRQAADELPAAPAPGSSAADKETP